MIKLRECHSRIRSHYLSDIKKTFLNLYGLDVLKEDPQAMAARVQYLLKHDCFLCPENTFEVRPPYSQFNKPLLRYSGYTGSKPSISSTSDCGGYFSEAL